MRVHLIDGTYELFRAYFGAPKALSKSGAQVGATRGLVQSLLALLREPGVTHVACAFDRLDGSFRNRIFDGYKTWEGVPEELVSQVPLAEVAVAALGMAVWSMAEFEADDSLATGAARFAREAVVEQVVIASPDKDLAQCISGSRVVCLDRLRRRVLDEAGTVEKFGVSPASIPDWLALVGDTADGIPGIPRWGSKSAATVLARWRAIDAIPDDPSRWEVEVRGAAVLAESLRSRREDAALYKTLATLRTDVPVTEGLAELEWRGAWRDELTALLEEIGEKRALERVTRWRS